MQAPGLHFLFTFDLNTYETRRKNRIKTIVIVDDDAGIQDSLALVFARNYQIVVYPDASAIIRGESTIPGIFLIDKQLPGIDGIDLCRHLKSMLQTANIPIIVMSASPAVSNMAKAAGADLFIEKPYTIKQLRDAVSQLTATN